MFVRITPTLLGAQRSVHMRLWYLLLVVALFMTPLVRPAMADAGIAGLIKDINGGTSPVGSSPANFVTIGGTTFFSANDGINGAELWKSDGTPAGTSLVKDIYVGPNSSSPAFLTNYAGTLFFSAADDSGGVELWKSDGSAVGTLRVKDINPGAAGSSINELTVVGSVLFFTASESTGGTELWKSNGTEAGTVRAKDIRAGALSSAPMDLTAVGSMLFFVANDGVKGVELWRSDTTNGETVLVKDINPNSASSNPTELTNVNGTLFFAVFNKPTGVELWKSNGTDAGTVLVKDIRSGSDGSSPEDLVVVNGVLFFTARDDVRDPTTHITSGHGRELWKSDGTDLGTVLIQDVRPGIDSAAPDNLTAVNGTLFFNADDGEKGRELWKIDDPANGLPVRIKDIRSGTAGVAFSLLGAVGNKLFFAANGDSAGVELWVSDGSEGGTQRVKDIYPGSNGSNPSAFADVDGELWLSADDGSHGTELWTSNGSAGGTSMLKDIASNVGNSNPSEFVNVNGTLFFTAFNTASGVELWQSKGSTADTSLVQDLVPGPTSSSPTELTSINGTLFFITSSEPGKGTLWKSDGTPAGTVAVTDIETDAEAPSFQLTSSNNTLFFVARDNQGTELWKSNGTAAGTVRVKNIGEERLSSNPANLIDVNGTLYFTAEDTDFGRELWKSNGTDAGTTRVQDINYSSDDSSPSDLVNVNGVLYFVADNGVNGRELWRSNGSSATTVLVKDIFPGVGNSSPSDLVNVNGVLYFVADNGVNGRELWRSNGSLAGTTLVKDIVPGSSSSLPSHLTSAKARLFFTAYTDTTGVELWVSDGTAAGTQIVKDILPGPTGSAPGQLAQVRSSKRILFSAYADAATGQELWVSDGTPDGTYQLQDIATGPAHANPADFTLVSSSILFSAADETKGTELWGLSANAPQLNAAPVISDALTIEGHINRTISAKLPVSDPDEDPLSISLLSQPSNGVLTLTNPTTGAFTYTPNPGFLGTDSFTLKANDGLVDSNVGTVTINITNIAPVATGAVLEAHANRAVSGTLSASDIDGDPLTFSIVANPVSGTVVISDPVTGGFTYTPNHGFLGTDSFSFKANDSVADSNVASVEVHVTNNPPVAHDSSISTAFNGPTNGQFSAEDPDGDPLTFILVSSPISGVVTLTNPATGAFTYTPNGATRGSDSFTFKVNDGLADSPVATVTLFIGNAAPVAESDTIFFPSGSTQIHGKLRGSDADGDPLTFILVADGKNGRVIISPASGEFTYIPNSAFNGSDSFKFKVKDGKVDSNVATVSIAKAITGSFVVHLPIIERQ